MRQTKRQTVNACPSSYLPASVLKVSCWCICAGTFSCVGLLATKDAGETTNGFHSILHICQPPSKHVGGSTDVVTNETAIKTMEIAFHTDEERTEWIEAFEVRKSPRPQTLPDPSQSSLTHSPTIPINPVTSSFCPQLTFLALVCRRCRRRDAIARSHLHKVKSSQSPSGSEKNRLHAHGQGCSAKCPFLGKGIDPRPHCTELRLSVYRRSDFRNIV